MAFPAALTNAVDGVTEIIAAHLNALEAKVGIDGSAVVTSLDYLLKNPASINPGHKHSGLWASNGDLQAIWVDAAGLIGLGTSAPLSDAKVTIVTPNYQYAAITLACSINDQFAKGAVICGARYSIANKPFSAIAAWDNNSIRSVLIGGGGFDRPDATYIKFFTASAYNETNNAGILRLSIDSAGSLLLGGLPGGTNAAKALVMVAGTAPTTAPADMAQLWVEDINAAAGKGGLHMMAESGTNKLIVAGVIIKGTIGDPTQVHEGLMVINTLDNTLKMYADGGWRQLAAWT
jgi:hypothetical protein